MTFSLFGYDGRVGLKRGFGARVTDGPTVKTDGPHTYSSTQFNLPTELADLVKVWCAQNIPDGILAGDGRENEPHVTVKYGLHTQDVGDVLKVVGGFGPVAVTMGCVSVFDTNPDYDVVKIDVDGAALRVLNDVIGKAWKSLANSDSHPDYRPHITIAYVAKGQGAQFVGDDTFEGIEFVGDTLKFSTPTGMSEYIPLKFVNAVIPERTTAGELLLNPDWLMTGTQFMTRQGINIVEVKEGLYGPVISDGAYWYDVDPQETIYVRVGKALALPRRFGALGSKQAMSLDEFYNQYRNRMPLNEVSDFAGDEIESIEQHGNGYEVTYVNGDVVQMAGVDRVYLKSLDLSAYRSGDDQFNAVLVELKTRGLIPVSVTKWDKLKRSFNREIHFDSQQHADTAKAVLTELGLSVGSVFRAGDGKSFKYAVLVSSGEYKPRGASANNEVWRMFGGGGKAATQKLLWFYRGRPGDRWQPPAGTTIRGKPVTTITQQWKNNRMDDDTYVVYYEGGGSDTVTGDEPVTAMSGKAAGTRSNILSVCPAVTLEQIVAEVANELRGM